MREEMQHHGKSNLSWERIAGSLISGFGTKAIAVGMALMLAHEVYTRVSAALSPVATALGAN
jgi:hypothetical protein